MLTRCLVAASLLSSHPLLAQPNAPRQHNRNWQAEVGGLSSSSGRTPFWLQTNQYGTVPKMAPTARLRTSVSQDYYQPDSLGRRPKADWGFGVELVGLLGQTQQLLLAQAYLKGRWGVFEFFGGRRQQLMGLGQSSLSSGSFSWSPNALPLPRLELSIPDYAPLGFTGERLALKGFFAHGWFGNAAFVQRSFLHQKAIYLRYGREQARLKLHAGFNHQAQWAGYAPFLETDPTSSFGGQIADSFVAYLNVVIPLKAKALKNLSKFTTYDQNRVGDHRGSAEAAMEIRLGGGTVWLYQQHFYDLGRKLYNLRNIEDGLYGVRFVRPQPHHLLGEVVVELFSSGSQGIVQFGRPLGGEAENYFINGQYPDSWSYRGRTIGTPFITQASDSHPGLERTTFSGYTAANQLISGHYGINNNRVWALYAAVAGALGSQWEYELKASYSKNYGTFSLPFEEVVRQFSAAGSLTKATPWLGGSALLVRVGYDQGQLLTYPAQVGLYVGLRKEWRHLSHPAN